MESRDINHTFHVFFVLLLFIFIFANPCFRFDPKGKLTAEPEHHKYSVFSVP